MGQTDEAAEEDLKSRIDDLDFSIHKSRRYHEFLCAFYEGWRDRMKVVTVVAGSSAFVLITADVPRFASIFAAVIALWAVIDIVASPDRKARLHSELRRSFTALAMKNKTAPLTEAAYQEISAERLRLEHDEPPCKRLIDLMARNDECRARDYPPDELVPLDRWQRRFGYYWTFGMERLEAWKASRQGGVIAFDLLDFK